jgi:two-component system, NtrC family, sensor kinase
MFNKLMNIRSYYQKYKTSVRYRLLILTSAPILLTLIAMLAIMFYWTVHYTWNNTLQDVSERLHVAQNSIELLQQRQELSLSAVATSYEFRKLLNNQLSIEKETQWLEQQRQNFRLDFIQFQAVQNVTLGSRLPLLTQDNEITLIRTSSLNLYSRAKLQTFSQDLADRAQISIVGVLEPEQRGLVSETVIAVRNKEQQLIGFLIGGLLLNNSTELVDRIRDLIYPSASGNLGTVTIFLDDIRVSTNVPLDSFSQQGRAIGTRAAKDVHDTVLHQGSEWVNLAHVNDAWYISAYQPLKNQNGDVLGMIYTGYLMWPFLQQYVVNILELCVITLIILLCSGVFVYRNTKKLVEPVERISKVVKIIQSGQSSRIGHLGLHNDHELTILAKQFDIMLDRLENQTEKIRDFANQLETKVQQRTMSLKEKTQQLEHHIDLLKQTRHKLVAREKLAALGELTAGIAHEINNPIAVILGNAELIRLLLKGNTEIIDEELDAIVSQVERVRNITSSLLQYSRKGRSIEELEHQPIDPIIEESVTLVKTGTNKREIQFTLHLSATEQAYVNRNQMLQILVNLQMNAIQAMDGHGILTISSQDWLVGNQAMGVTISICDQGCGIDPDAIARIFDPFYTTKQDGTGLGLSVCQSLLNQVGGEIAVDSQIGIGSCFTIYLPLNSDDDES